MEFANEIDGRSARKETSRRRLLDAAFQMLIAEGVSGITMRHLAKIAEMSPKTVYNVFGSKAELLNAMINDLPNRGPKRLVSDRSKNDLDRLLAEFDLVTEEWVSQGSLIRSLLVAAKRNGQLAPTMIPSVRRKLLDALKVFEAKDAITEIIPLPIMASQIAYANAGLFDEFLAGSLSNDELWVGHRMNLLVPLRATANSNFCQKIDAKVRETLDRYTNEKSTFAGHTQSDEGNSFD